MYACQAAEVLAEALRAQACRLQLLSNSAGGYALNPKPKWKLSKIRDPKVYRSNRVSLSAQEGDSLPVWNWSPWCEAGSPSTWISLVPRARPGSSVDWQPLSCRTVGCNFGGSCFGVQRAGNTRHGVLDPRHGLATTL